MQQFLVPQFLDVEPKVIGPVSVRQFIIMMICLLILVIEYKIFDFGLFIIGGILTLGVFVILAFMKVNGRAFHFFILTVLQTMKRPKLRVWNKELSDKELKSLRKPRKDKGEKMPERLPRKIISRSRLQELSLIVNTGGIYRPDDEELEQYAK